MAQITARVRAVASVCPVWSADTAGSAEKPEPPPPHQPPPSISSLFRPARPRVLAGRGSVDTTRGAGGETRYRLRHGSFTHHLACRVCGRSVEVDAREVWE